MNRKDVSDEVIRLIEKQGIDMTLSLEQSAQIDAQLDAYFEDKSIPAEQTARKVMAGYMRCFAQLESMQQQLLAEEMPLQSKLSAAGDYGSVELNKKYEAVKEKAALCEAGAKALLAQTVLTQAYVTRDEFNVQYTSEYLPDWSERAVDLWAEHGQKVELEPFMLRSTLKCDWETLREEPENLLAEMKAMLASAKGANIGS